jgi:hypothetical protein
MLLVRQHGIYGYVRESARGRRQQGELFVDLELDKLRLNKLAFE